MSNETDLISVLNEAAHILYTSPPDNLRWPIIDELEGFARMLQDGQLITQREQKLVDALHQIKANTSYSSAWELSQIADEALKMLDL